MTRRLRSLDNLRQRLFNAIVAELSRRDYAGVRSIQVEWNEDTIVASVCLLDGRQSMWISYPDHFRVHTTRSVAQRLVTSAEERASSDNPT